MVEADDQNSFLVCLFVCLCCLFVCLSFLSSNFRTFVLIGHGTQIQLDLTKLWQLRFGQEVDQPNLTSPRLSRKE